MISYLKGIISHITASELILEVSGIGFKLHVTHQIAEKYKPGEELKINVNLFFKNENFQLYAFITKLEMQLFLELIKISGVGPKTALSILDQYSPIQIIEAVKLKNQQFFQSISGIGKKTAERILFELNYSTDNLLDEFSSENRLTTTTDYSNGCLMEVELKSALSNMGFKDKQISGVWSKGFQQSENFQSNFARLLSLLRNNANNI